jgi:hypothetical protein
MLFNRQSPTKPVVLWLMRLWGYYKEQLKERLRLE